MQKINYICFRNYIKHKHSDIGDFHRNETSKFFWIYLVFLCWKSINLMIHVLTFILAMLQLSRWFFSRNRSYSHFSRNVKNVFYCVLVICSMKTKNISWGILRQKKTCYHFFIEKFSLTCFFSRK